LHFNRDLLDPQARQGQKGNKDFLEWKDFQDQKERKGIQAHREQEVPRETG
jgi:hypothetical protein